MQTFVPLPDYKMSMNCLDKSRLGNQVWREGMTLIKGGWSNHPASKMWRGYEYHLGLYLLAGCDVLKEKSPSAKTKIKIPFERMKEGVPIIKDLINLFHKE